MAAPIALTIAGSDSSGGAGVQADLKTFSALGVYGASAITALTAQNTRGVQGVHVTPSEFVAAQVRSVLGDLDVRAVKTGMLATAPVIEAVLEALKKFSGPLVADPVMISQSGDSLLAQDAVEIIRDRLLPRATLITPNLPEAAALLQVQLAQDEQEMERQGQALLKMGAQAVLLKGGHAPGMESADILVTAKTVRRYAAPRIDTRHTHGTGCSLSAAITAFLARGLALEEAIGQAKAWLTIAIREAASLGIGKGAGPVHHFHGLWRD